MSRKLNEFVVPFPPGLMSSAQAPSVMSLDFAREIRNMIAAQDGAGVKRNGCINVTPDLPSGEVFGKIMSYTTDSGVQQVLAATTSGKLYLRGVSSWTELISGLDTDATVRAVQFNGKLIMCNGVDDVLAWDGNTLETVEEKIVDLGASLTYVSATTFTIESDTVFYPVGSEVRARLGGSTYVTSTVASASGTGTVTVTLNDSVLTASLDQVEFTRKPPAFAYMYTAHDRLWGFGSGPLSANSFASGADRMRVYYTYGLNDETAWHDTAGLRQSINLADKTIVADEILAMAVKDGLTVFFGRNSTQMWVGQDPTATGDFSWQKTLPVGVIHGDLVVDLPNDVGFFTRYGARTLSRTLQTEQLDVGDFGAEMDPQLASAVNTLLADDATYRTAQAFSYTNQGWFGFKVGDESLIFQLRGRGKGWVIFDGLFSSCRAFLNASDGTLYLAGDDKLYTYDESVYADDGEAIRTRWWMPWLRLGKLKWANKFYEIITGQEAGLSLTVQRYKNYNSGNYMQTMADATIPADYWDEADWDEAQWDNVAPSPDRTRDAFVADTLSYAIESNSTDGPLTLFGLKLYGVSER